MRRKVRGIGREMHMHKKDTSSVLLLECISIEENTGGGRMWAGGIVYDRRLCYG